MSDIPPSGEGVAATGSMPVHVAIAAPATRSGSRPARWSADSGGGDGGGDHVRPGRAGRATRAGPSPRPRAPGRARPCSDRLPPPSASATRIAGPARARSHAGATRCGRTRPARPRGTARRGGGLGGQEPPGRLQEERLVLAQLQVHGDATYRLLTTLSLLRGDARHAVA